MAVRLSGLSSGLDTESIIKELMSVQSMKLTKLENKKTKLEWKEDKWSELNTKIYALYTGELSQMRLQSTYLTKSVTVSDSSKATITAGSSVPTGSHTVEIKSVASSQYVTGEKLSSFTSGSTTTDATSISSSTKLSALGISSSATFTIESSSCSADDDTLEVTDSTTISDLSKWAKERGVNISYDSTNQRFFVSSTGSGTENAFSLTSTDTTGTSPLSVMGIGEITTTGITSGTSNASFVAATDCTIVYNDAEFTSSSNTVSVNGLTINAIEVTTSPIKVSVSTDASGIYDTIKSFVSKYNSILQEVNDLYYADDASDYDILSDDEREAMSDEQIEKWETKIKDSLLRSDTTLKSIQNALKSITSITVSVNGKAYSLASFGVGTTDYTEYGLLHIDGDSDDTSTASNTDKLLTALGSDPELVMNVFTEVASSLYSSLTTKMSATSISSALTLYNDKQISSQISNYEDEIEEMEDRLADLEDRYYSKFSAMEVALSKLNSQTSYISSLFSS